MRNRPILKNKLYLYMTEFFAGMSVMAVELGASRLLAPYFSSSQIVWTIIIGTIMIALALGNFFGGRSADRNPDPDRLYKRLIVAAVWIAAIPVLGKYIILLLSAALVLTVSTNLLIWAAFLACMIIFVFPLFLLGTVTPSLVKYTVESLENNGKIVGTLGAFNTVGSIIGTFLPTFITIPAVGTAVTFLIFSGIILAIGLIYFFSAKTSLKLCIVAAVVFVLCSMFGSAGRVAFWEKNLLFEGESIYNYLQVKETDDSIILATNVLFGVQSVMKKGDGLTGMYYDYALAAPVMAGAAKKKNTDVLVLGNGTGTFASECRKYFPGSKVEGVEIDPQITELAKTYFKLPSQVQVATYDGRAYLEHSDKKYDVIMVDAFQDITIPFQMSTEEFFSLVKSHLKNGGVMLVNLNMYSKENIKSGKGANLDTYLEDTVSSVFKKVYTVDVVGYTNREIFASDSISPDEALRSQISGVTDTRLNQMMQKVSYGLEHYTGGDDILTDDRAPVEVLGMRMIDELIRDEIGYYKQIFREKGLQGLLNEA